MWLHIYLLVGLIIVAFCFCIAARIGSESRWMVALVGLALLPAWLTIALVLVIILVVNLIIEDQQRRKSLKRWGR